MHAISSKRAKRSHDSSSSQPAYKSRLSFYRIPPNEEVVLDEFDAYAMDRLKVLQDIDAARMRNLKGEEFNNRIGQVVKDLLPLRKGQEEDIRKDVISHFLLRLAYCRTQEDRKWFITQEKSLLKFRLESEDIATFLADNDLYYKGITKQEFAKHEQALRAVILSSDRQAQEVTQDKFYKVPFEEAPDLIGQRRVFLHHGDAYVYRDNLVSIVLGRYRAHISQALVAAQKALPSLSEKFAKVGPRLENMSRQYTGPDYSRFSQAVGSVTPDQLDLLSRRSFPLCMHNMHQHLRKHHHLKHTGRMQYGLFLKGIGLSMEDALVFWRTEFGKSVGVDKFEKQYAYNIRHNYGKEGIRKSYTPYSCPKIIQSPVPIGAAEQHGCPYAQDLNALLAELKRLNISTPEHIVELAKKGAHQVACAKHFESIHPGAKDLAINHPNYFFDESMKFYSAHDSSSGSGNSSSSHNTSNSSTSNGAPAVAPAQGDSNSGNAPVDPPAAPATAQDAVMTNA